MLELKNIVKDYVSGNNVTHALKGISVNFRKNEFVSILGASGCGKTTTLNIIGGLDRYTSGDLVIKGKSTKNYTDRDWDTYRNHSIGFVFQSYNLIPHLSILGNVELALTIAGQSKDKRTAAAQKALERVGLGDIAKKRPNQLSGGQCQRVAIARALVNNPEILLADEPTGALDSETSVQIMNLLKEVAKDRLVIMVTHNPDLAKKYSTRIITMSDGNLLKDSNPYKGEVLIKDEKNIKKSKMSLPTAFGLSARNLLAKIKRTALVCVAGSIGIIGVSTVLAVSTGVKKYIRSMQDDLLSGNPITIEKTALDIGGLMNAFSKTDQANAVEKSIEEGKINIDYMVKYLAEQKDNLESFSMNNSIDTDYVEFVKNMSPDFYSAMDFDFGQNFKLNMFTDIDMTGDTLGGDPIKRTMSLHQLETSYVDIVKSTEFGEYASVISLFTDVIFNGPDQSDYILQQYDILNEGGKIATEENEIMLVVNKDREMTDIFLGQMGYYSEDEFISIVNKYAYGSKNESNPYEHDSIGPERFSYEDLVNKKFYYVPYSTGEVLKENKSNNPEMLFNLTGNYIDMPLTYNGEFGTLPEGTKELKITAILQPKENVSYGALQRGMIVSPKLQQAMLDDAKNAAAVNTLKDCLEAYKTLDPAKKAAYSMAVQMGYKYNYTIYDENLGEKVLHKVDKTGPLDKVAVLGVTNLGAGAGGMGGAFSSIFTKLLGNSYSIENQFETQIRSVGGISDIPTQISIYPKSFDEKYLVTNYLDQWNNKKVDIVLENKTISAEAREDIAYNDTLELIIGLINNMIEIITIALVAFTSLSLVVSTVMIGIITYVSVVERTKEIGIIRSLGGRKLDVSNLFNVETFIIGSISGIFGVAVTYGISGIINLLINSKAKLGALVMLPWHYALIIIAISIGLTLISGLIPAKAAAHRDPVVALRSAE